MVQQLEDCVDVLKVAYDDTYDFLFFFDHSCGHDRKWDDALCASNMVEIRASYGQLALQKSVWALMHTPRS
jgi:hypothetical protein